MFSLITLLSTLLALVPFLRPADRARNALLWPLKLVAGALTPVLGLLSGAGALLGLARRNRTMAASGILGLGLVVRFLLDVRGAQAQYNASMGSLARARLSKHPCLPQHEAAARTPSRASLHRNVAFGASPLPRSSTAETGSKSFRLAPRRSKNEGPLLADIWEPEAGAPRSGLGVVYVHGGGWRIGDKDMATRPFFQHLVGQGHVVMDINYTLWPEADIPSMVGEVKRAVLWLKGRSRTFGIHPERLVLIGGSAGAHLALLAAYTPGHSALPPDGVAGDVSVHGVVAFYPPIDLLHLWELKEGTFARQPGMGMQGLLERAAERMLDWTFALPDETLGPEVRFRNFLPTILGGEPSSAAETYRLLSPNSHVGPHCPPTLLLQGLDDVFLLAPAVRKLHQDLEAAGVPSMLIEYPHAEHAFDLVLPKISPLAKAAISEVEKFLAWLASR